MSDIGDNTELSYHVRFSDDKVESRNREDTAGAEQPRQRRQNAWQCRLAWVVAATAVLAGIMLIILDRELEGGLFSISSSSSEEASLPVDFRCFETHRELVVAVDRYLANKTDTLATTYGLPLSTWCVDEVTDFSYLFSTQRNPLVANATALLLDGVSAWNMSSAVNVSGMFYGASRFNSDLTDWDTSSVQDASFLFREAHAFDGNISTWNTSSLTTTEGMFRDSYEFDGDLSAWDTGRVLVMESMFREAKSFRGHGLENWNVEKVTNMAYMFRDCFRFDEDVSSWQVSQVRDMQWMWSGAESFMGSLSTWDVSAVEDMEFMFFRAFQYNDDLSRWRTSRVVNMAGLFRDAFAFNENISTWDVSNVWSVVSMFQGATSFNGDLAGWKVRSTTTMRLMFANATSFEGGGIEKWNVSTVFDTHGMFQGATSFNTDISAWNLTWANEMSYMFQNASSFRQDLCAWGPRLASIIVPNVTGVFEGSHCLVQSEPSLSGALPVGPLCSPCGDSLS